MPAKKITLTETELPFADAEVVVCFLAAHRAKKQAESILKKLSKRVLKLSKENPALLFDGARITGGKMGVWSYDSASVVIAEYELNQAQKRARAGEDGTATATIVEFPQVRELAKFAKQTPQPETPGIFRALFSSCKS